MLSCCQEHSKSAIRLLLSHGASVTCRDSDVSRHAAAVGSGLTAGVLDGQFGWTALHFAAENNQTTAIALLLEAGAVVNATDKVVACL